MNTVIGIVMIVLGVTPFIAGLVFAWREDSHALFWAITATLIMTAGVMLIGLGIAVIAR